MSTNIVSGAPTLHGCFSNSLIIHQVKQRKLQLWRRCVYPVSISIDFVILLLRLLPSFCFDWEDISSTRDSVSSAIQTPQISSKILQCASYFQLSSRCLNILMKHCLLCLIYYFTDTLNTNTSSTLCWTGYICWYIDEYIRPYNDWYLGQPTLFQWTAISVECYYRVSWLIYQSVCWSRVNLVALICCSAIWYR